MKTWHLIPSILALVILGGPTTIARGPNGGVDSNVNAVSDDTAGVDDTTSPRREQPEPSIAINPLDPRIMGIITLT